MRKTFTFTGIIAVTVITLAILLAQARAAVTVYAEDVPSNAVPAQQGPSTSLSDHVGKYAADIETKRIETERKMAADRTRCAGTSIRHIQQLAPCRCSLSRLFSIFSIGATSWHMKPSGR